MLKPACSLTLAFVASSLSSLAACAPDEEALIVRYAPAWEEEDGALQCRVQPDGNESLIRGVLDLSFATGYLQPFVLQNNLTPGGGPTSGNNGTDDSEIELRGVSVRLELPQDPSVIATLAGQNEALVEFRTVLPTTSMTGGDKLATMVEVVPPATAAMLGDVIERNHGTSNALTLMAWTMFHADRGSNSSLNDNIDNAEAFDFFEVDSREFGFPIDLCFDCLRHCPWAGNSGVSEQVSVGLCNRAQDALTIPQDCYPPPPEDGG